MTRPRRAGRIQDFLLTCVHKRSLLPADGVTETFTALSSLCARMGSTSRAAGALRGDGRTVSPTVASRIERTPTKPDPDVGLRRVEHRVMTARCIPLGCFRRPHDRSATNSQLETLSAAVAAPGLHRFLGSAPAAEFNLCPHWSRRRIQGRNPARRSHARARVRGAVSSMPL